MLPHRLHSKLQKLATDPTPQACPWIHPSLFCLNWNVTKLSSRKGLHLPFWSAGVGVHLTPQYDWQNNSAGKVPAHWGSCHGAQQAHLRECHMHRLLGLSVSWPTSSHPSDKASTDKEPQTTRFKPWLSDYPLLWAWQPRTYSRISLFLYFSAF